MAARSTAASGTEYSERKDKTSRIKQETKNTGQEKNRGEGSRTAP
jgi:hypothetical protein